MTSSRKVLASQLRTQTPEPAVDPDQVICCGHDLDAHDDDGCTVGWIPADTSRHPSSDCPCRVRGWARA